MSISSALSALADDVTAARAKITSKGGTVPPNGGTSQLVDDIDTIPSGGATEPYVEETYNSKHYICTADANVYAPGVYGWEGAE